MTRPTSSVHAPEPEAARVVLLRQALGAEPGLEFAVLIGSRAAGKATADSDWDIAVQWRRDIDWLEQLGRSENLRRRLGTVLAVAEIAIDLIDVPRASLGMRAAIAEEGIVPKGEDDLPWQRALRPTWRELEDYDWEQAHAPSGLYHAETRRIAAEQGGLLDQARGLAAGTRP